jgi:hypothetical protein
MITITGLTLHIPESSEPPWIELTEQLKYKNETTGKEWTFEPGFTSDGATRPKPFRAFDRFTLEWFSHDQDCENATTWKEWQLGNNDCYDNLRDGGMPRWRAMGAWTFISGNSAAKKMTGRLK